MATYKYKGRYSFTKSRFIILFFFIILLILGHLSFEYNNKMYIYGGFCGQV